MVEPNSPEQWQEAVDAAAGALAVSAAVSYGLIVGGPVVDDDRCLDILKRGAALGHFPSGDAIEQFARELAETENGQP